MPTPALPSTMNTRTKTGEEVVNGYHNDCGDIIKIYCDENKYTSADVNNEFMKRLFSMALFDNSKSVTSSNVYSISSSDSSSGSSSILCFLGFFFLFLDGLF